MRGEVTSWHIEPLCRLCLEAGRSGYGLRTWGGSLLDSVMGRVRAGKWWPVLRNMMKRGHDVESAPSI
jgi:hypothetical protein